MPRPISRSASHGMRRNFAPIRRTNRPNRVAGTNIGGGYATFPGVVGTAITKVCSTEVARTGLTEREAARDGFQAVAATIESTVATLIQYRVR